MSPSTDSYDSRNGVNSRSCLPMLKDEARSKERTLSVGQPGEGTAEGIIKRNSSKPSLDRVLILSIGFFAEKANHGLIIDL